MFTSNSLPASGSAASENSRDKGIGTGTPLKDDSLTPMSQPSEKHAQVLGIGPGTPWKEQDQEQEADAEAKQTPPPALANVPEPQAEEMAVDEEEGADFGSVLAAAMEQEVEPGEIVTGRILRIDADGVIVDVGYKSEGIVPREEFVNQRGELTAKVGAEVEVLLQGRENREGLVRLSKRQVDKRRGWERAQAALTNNASLEGVVYAKCKGGFMVDMDGVQAFLPGSHVDIKHSGDPDACLGQHLAFKVIKLNRERGNIVVSHRNHLIDERNAKRSEAISRLAPGRLVHGVVKSLAKFGAFIDVGGIEGLLRIEDMAWSHITHPRQVVKVGDEIEVLVLSLDEAANKIALGLKQKSQDPWTQVATKYPVGSLVEGEVVSLADFGAFLRLEEGLEGLLPVSEMSWTKRILHPKDVFKPGDRVRVKVLSVDPQAKKISLGLKQTEPDPYILFIDSHKAGEIVDGEVRSLTGYGAFVELAEGVSGLLHISDLSWDESVKQPADILQRGDKVKVKILEIHPDKKKIALGLKQLSDDPWQVVAKKYPVGKVITGKVVRNTKIGAFVQVEPGIEGLIHVSQLTQRPGGPVDVLPIGDQISAKVIKIIPAEHKLGLSIKELIQDQEEAEVRKYLAPANKRGMSLAEISGVDPDELLKRMGGTPNAQG